MYVCEHCLMAIESHEGSQFHKRINTWDMPEGIIEENDEGEFMKCEWCEDKFDPSEMYEI